MELKDFNELCKRDFDNGAVRNAIRQVFKERDELRDKVHHLTSQSSGGANICKKCGKPMGNPVFCIWCTESGEPPAADLGRYLEET